MESKYKLPKVKVKEEKYNLNEEDIVLPEGSIKYELNLIEFPIFSKNRKIEINTKMTYSFSENNNEYLSITPGNDPENICNKILQEFDEKIFYALMRIYEETGERKIVSDYPQLLGIANVKYDTRNLFRVKDSLERMKNCTIRFNNSFYNAKAKLEGFDYIKQTKTLNLLSTLESVTFEKIKKETEKKEYEKYFNKHKNIKEIFVAILNENIIENIKNKSHKYFKTQDLLEIENATARKIYIMLIKWRYWEKKNRIRRTVRFLASRIPMSWDKSNIPSTIKNIEKACIQLITLNKIEGYVINKEKGLANASIDFIFSKLKDKGILGELNEIIGIEETGQENMEIIDLKKEEVTIKEVIEDLSSKSKEGKQYSENVFTLFEILPFEEKIDLRKKDLENLLEEHSFEMLKEDIEYCKKKKTDDFFAYFLKSVKSGHYSLNEIEKKKKKEERKKENENFKEKEKLLLEEEYKNLEERAIDIYSRLSEEKINEYSERYEKQKKYLKIAGVDLKKFILNEIEYELNENR